MKKITVSLLLLTLLCLNAAAQLKDEDYRKQANAVRDYVWHLKIKAFDDKKVPEEYNKYSKIIIAKHEEITALTKSKIKWTGLGVGAQRDLTYTHTTRELIKINDAAALEDYSDITFQKFAQRYKNKLTTYLGVRVIKSDGTMKEIDPDEMVLTDNTDKNKKAKIAISDLQVGDIIDYFIQTVEFYNGGSSLDFENFIYADEDPIMHYSVHIEASSKMAVEYRALNGAPEFKESRNDNDDIILDAEKNNIPPFPTNLWMSAYRQLPLVRLHMIFKAAGTANSGLRKAGEVYKNPDADEVIDSYDGVLKNYVMGMRVGINQYDDRLKKLAASYLKNNGGGSVKDNSTSLYYATKHYFFMEPQKDDVAVVDNRRNYYSPDAVAFLSMLESLFGKFGINAQYILVPSKYGPRTNEVMIGGDLQLALLTEDNHIFSSESVFDSPDVIPYYMEGQQGSTLDYHMTMRGAKSDKGSYNTKYTTAAQNMHTEDLLFTFNPAEPQKIKVDRKTTLTGLTRLDNQRELLLYEDFYEEERKTMGLENSFYDELKDSKKGRKIVDEYQHAFDEARKEWKDNFKDEINGQFDVKPEELISCKIEQSGVFEKKPAMIYTTQFTVNAWVKKAGNNFILDAGKMIGEQLHVKPEQRDRKVDVYMPNARTFQYNVSIPVPAGYTAEGLDKLNTSMDNVTGSFTTTAKLDGGNIKITVTKVYKNAFEKAENWPLLLKMLDAATAFEESKIMLRKS